MFPLRYPLDRLPKDAFNALCLAILRNSISPNVRLVAARGRDGGRDAVLSGGPATSNYPHHQYWIFQFKHYQGDLGPSRSHALTDFRNEVAATLKKNPGCDAYFFLTTVPFSAVPGAGLFDRVATFCAEIQQTSSCDVRFWDGLQLCSLIDEMPTKYATFFSSAPPIVIPRIMTLDPMTLGIRRLPKIESLPIDDDEPLSPQILEWLYPRLGTMLGPEGGSPIWELLAEGNYGTILRITRSIGKMSPIQHLADYADPIRRGYAWSQMLYAHARIHLGNASEGVRVLRRLSSSVEIDQAPELAAWIYNLLSIAAGKLGNEAGSQRYGMTAASLARRVGLFWLASSVQLRLLHRASWNSWERGGRFDHSLFENLLQSYLAQAQCSGILEMQQLRITQQSLQALHYSWDESTQAVAMSSCRTALHLLSGQFDRDEAARMVSELGRMEVSSSTGTSEGIKHLKVAAQMRSETGNLARLRYDLSWLASAYVSAEDGPAADACAKAAIRLHNRLYGRQLTDRALIKRLTDIVAKSPRAKSGPFFPWFTVGELDLLAQSSGIDPIWWEITLKTPR